MKIKKNKIELKEIKYYNTAAFRLFYGIFFYFLIYLFFGEPKGGTMLLIFCGLYFDKVFYFCKSLGFKQTEQNIFNGVREI